MTRLTDEEYARHAAQHALYPEGQAPRPDRLTDLGHHGVTDEKSLGDHALKVMHDPETKCFRGHEGRECFRNDRLNTIVRTNEKNPELCQQKPINGLNPHRSQDNEVLYMPFILNILRLH